MSPGGRHASSKQGTLSVTDGAVSRGEVDMIFVSNCVTGVCMSVYVACIYGVR